MSTFPIGGIGITPPFAPPAEKKFSSSECLQALMDKIRDEPELVQNQINIVTKEQSGEMQTKYWPAIFDADNWSRLSTHRPTTDSEGKSLGGTDREVRTYENDFWEDNRRTLKGVVTTDFGEITSIEVEARW
jgi:hypothetical protein